MDKHKQGKRDDDRGHTKSIFSQIQRKSLDKELLGYPDNE